jgi:hypothetical protein
MNFNLEKFLKKYLVTLDDIISIPAQELADGRLAKKLWQTVNDPYWFYELGDTNELSWNLEEKLKLAPSLAEQAPSLYRQYQSLVIYLRLLAIPVLPEDFIRELHSRYLLFAFRRGIDLKERVYLLYSYLNFSPTEMRIYRSNILRALVNNLELLGVKNIMLGDRLVSPTVSNWLKDYVNIVGVESAHTNLDHTNYIIRSKNAQLLNQKEKNDLFNVLEFYDYVLMPHFKDDINLPYTYDFSAKPTLANSPDKKLREQDINEVTAEPIPGGIRLYFGGAEPTGEEEENAGARKGFSVRMAPERTAAPSFDSVADIQDKISAKQLVYAPDSARVIASEEEISKTYGDDPDKILPFIFKAYKNSKADELLAGLSLLARAGRINTLWENEMAKTLFSLEIFPRLAKQNTGLNTQALMKNFEQENPVYLKILLKFLINKVINKEQEKGAYFASQLENNFAAFGQNQYLGLAYYNVQTDRFEWANVKVNNDGSLVME